MPHLPLQKLVKRFVDVVAAACLLVALAPLLALVAVLIKRDSRGPVCYNRPRVGKDGRVFVMYKFRTMVRDAEGQLAGLQHRNPGGAYMVKIVDDPRVTRVGRLLRVTSIDELPQLVNVLRGEVSLVGPRPQAVEEVALYTPQQRQRLCVRPGITGLWQVNDRHTPSFDAWMHWDLRYITRWNLCLDVSIMARTVGIILYDVRQAGRNRRQMH